MATSVLGLKTFAASDPVDYNEVNDNYNKIDNGVKTAMQGRAAHNIMDNSYFIKNAFIAQAGVNGAHGAEKYLGDRWIGHSYIGATEQNDGMVLTSSNQFAYIKQKVNTVVGKTYTFAIYATGISNNHRIDVYDGGMNSSIASNTMNSSNGILLVSFVATTETTCLLYYPGYASSGGSAKIVWAALYEGAYTADTLPDYVPKDNELAECQLYNREEYVVPVIKSKDAVFIIGTVIQMRDMGELKPTITLKKFTRPGVIDVTSFGASDKIDIENLGKGRYLLINAILTSCQDYAAGYLRFSINADL